MPRETNDIEYTNTGSFILMAPLTPRACDWVAENLAGETTVIGGQIVIEPRYFPDLAYGAQEDGLTSNVTVVPR